MIGKLMQEKSNAVFMLFFGFMYFWGVLSKQHYAVGIYALYIHLIVTCVLCIGMGVWFYFNKIQHISNSFLLWVAAFFMIILQPLISTINYIDALIFPLGMLFVTTLISLIVANMTQQEKDKSVHFLAWIIGVVGILTVVTQFLQLVFHNLPFIMPPNNTSRLSANIAQPNMAAFVIVMGIASFIYIFYKNYNKKILLVYSLTSCAILLLSIGVAFSSSRVALFLTTVALLSILFYKSDAIKNKVVFFGLSIIIVFVGYNIGIYLLNAYATVDVTSSVGRLVGENSLRLRTNLLYQAKMAFLSNPITGIGYDNYGFYGINHIDEIPWYNNSRHAHNIFAHVAAEFGLIGLALLFGFLVIILKNLISFLAIKLPKEKVLVCTLLAIIGVYSLSEFPLWYARFLYLTAFLIAILDTPKLLKKPITKIGVIFCAFISTISLYYIIQYNKILIANETITMMSVPGEQKLKAYREMPNVFGFRDDKEALTFIMMPADATKLTEQTELGYRVVKRYGEIYMLEKQATLLALQYRQQEALQMYKTICKKEQSEKILENKIVGCEDTIDAIKEVNPPDAENYIKMLKSWKGYDLHKTE